MDTPVVIALIVFFGIFLMFFIVSLLSDLWIFLVSLGSATAAYFIRDWYPMFFEVIKTSPVVQHLHLMSPDKLDSTTIFVMVGLLIVVATILCIPALPFSATYRQMLGANRLTRRDETFIRGLIKVELDNLRDDLKKRLSLEKQDRQDTKKTILPTLEEK
jgi:hypothetical protein